MKNRKKIPVLEKLKKNFPELEFAAYSTNQRGKRKLITVRGLSSNQDIDYWVINTVYPVWRKMVEIIQKYKKGMSNFRLMFVQDNQFMLHSPDVGCGNVFVEFFKPINIEVYGYYEKQHYVGECYDINEVIEYLTQTKIRF